MHLAYYQEHVILPAVVLDRGIGPHGPSTKTSAPSNFQLPASHLASQMDSQANGNRVVPGDDMPFKFCNVGRVQEGVGEGFTQFLHSKHNSVHVYRYGHDGRDPGKDEL